MADGTLYRLAPPAPVYGGARVHCPMVDVPRIESGRYQPGDPLTCRWTHKAGKRALRAYRRHWYRQHWLPFTTETESLISLLVRPD